MLGSFLPPVVFEITANAGQAIASFNKVNASLKLMEAQALKTGIAVSRLEKATVVATGFLKSFGLVAAAVGAVGVHEFMQLEKNMTLLGRAMANAGVNTAEYRKQVEQTLIAQERLGFDAADTAKAMSILVAATGNVTQSQKLLSVSMDLARFKGMGVEETARLMARATQGSARAFREFGITLDASKPKAEAAQEAIDKLAEKLKGTSEAYLKTFRGQMALLQVNIQNFAEAVGSILVPALNKMIAGFRVLFGWISQHKTVLIALTVTLTGALVAAIVLVTKKLWAQAAAWAAANWEIIAVVAAIGLLVAGFIKAWNASENVRKAIIYLGKGFINLGKWTAEVVGTIVNGFLLIVRGAANVQIALGKLTGDKEKVKTGKATLDWIDETNAKIKGLIQGFDKANEKWTALQFKKIDTSKFKLPDLAFKIPEFTNGMNDAADATDQLSQALVTARQKVKDFNDALGVTAKDLKLAWESLVGRDIAGAIQEGLLNPIDQLVVKAQKAVNSYQSASSDYQSALGKLTSAQNNYLASLEGTDIAAQAAAESALKVAEDTINNLNDIMGNALADLQKLQDDMINAIVDAYNKIGELEAERTAVLADAQEQRISLEKDYNAKVADIRKQYDRDVLNAQIDAAKRSAEIVKQSVDQLRGVYKNATYKNIGDIFSSLTFQGRYLKGGTTEKILAALGLQTSKAQTLADDAAKLAGLGFSQTFIEEVVAQGPDVGHQLASTIMNSTPASIKQMQDYWNALQSTSSHGVDAVARQLNSGITLATEELTAQLAQVKTDLNTTLQALQIDLQDNLLKAFGDYSDALDAINRKTAQQIAAIDTQIQSLYSKIQQLQNALDLLSTLNAPGTSGSGLSLTGAVEEYDGYIPPEIIDAVSKSTTDTEWAGFINFGDSLQAFADSLNGKGAPNTSSPTGTTTNTSGLDTSIYGPGKIPYAAAPTVTVVANTNASPNDIATAVGWTIRTSADVQYVTRGGTGGAIRSDLAL